MMEEIEQLAKLIIESKKTVVFSWAAEELLNGEVLRVVSTPDSSRATKIGYT